MYLMYCYVMCLYYINGFLTSIFEETGDLIMLTLY